MPAIKIIKVINILVSLFLGGMLFLGGVKKFEKPIPPPTQQMEQIKKGEFDSLDQQTLKIKNYFFGLKQTNYFWQLLGICEIIAGVLIFSQIFRLVGALMAVPITLQIFLFHFFLEPNEMGELVETGMLLLINLWLITYEYPKWKNLIITKSIFN